jgi:hypothetical protein
VGAVKVNLAALGTDAYHSDITGLLTELKANRCKIFIVFATEDLASKVVAAAQDLGLVGKDTVWIFSDGTTGYDFSVSGEVVRCCPWCLWCYYAFLCANSLFQLSLTILISIIRIIRNMLATCTHVIT